MAVAMMDHGRTDGNMGRETLRIEREKSRVGSGLKAREFTGSMIKATELKLKMTNNFSTYNELIALG